MDSKKRKNREMAKKIRDKNPDLEAPLNDIEECISDVLSTGVSREKAKGMVPKMMTGSSSRNENGDRNPNKYEILLYDLPDDLEEIYIDPM